ncbi:SRPBCC family protein [Aureimonas glaciei]|uniref:MxaD family protein n=1 Tax=Aureimonas glaciei TaxID=1776957 RepID=A0A917D9V7_9HYPH|nr:SRPBCC family protein [Aureimonas glaciei]GGD15026.1 MxaD family protein [Aureimonas glaciei]
MTTRTILIAAGLLALATPALAIDVERSAEVTAAPAKVWAMIGEFCGIGDWHPAVEKCSLSEADGIRTRTLSLAGGGTLVETETSRDDSLRSYGYKIVDGPLPVANYMSMIAVREGDEAGESEIIWTGRFDAKGATEEKATEAIVGIYESGIAALVEKLQQ